MVMSDTHSSPTQDRASECRAAFQNLVRVIDHELGKNNLAALIQEQGFAQYTTMADDGTQVSVLHDGLSPYGFNTHNVAQLIQGYMRAASDSPHYAPQQQRHSSHPPHPSPPLQPPSASSVPRTQPDHNWTAMSLPPATTQTKRSGFTCNFCMEEGLSLACTRKNDLKRHIEDFHHTNTQWLCPVPECGMVFDWESAFKAHAKTHHEVLRLKPQNCMVELCEQVVFACGFETCMQVFEAASDKGGDAVFKDYLVHVIKHYDEGLTSGQWSYSRRMRNLIRQHAMGEAWKAIERKEPHNRLRWDPQNSNILRKKLETRHIDSVQGILDAAFALGWLPDKQCEPLPGLQRPVRSQCAMSIMGHAPSASAVAMHPLPMQVSTAPVHHYTASPPPQHYYAAHPSDPRAYNMPPHQPVYSPHSPPMYITNHPAAEHCSPASPAEYHRSLTMSPPAPLYKTLPQMMREEEHAATAQTGMSIDPQLYVEWTPECDVYSASTHATPQSQQQHMAGFGSPVVKDEMEMDEDDMFPPLEVKS